MSEQNIKNTVTLHAAAKQTKIKSMDLNKMQANNVWTMSWPISHIHSSLILVFLPKEASYNL